MWDVLAKAGLSILIPFPVEEDMQLPVKTGAWISFELYTNHPSLADERWITQRCSSPVWLRGRQSPSPPRQASSQAASGQEPQAGSGEGAPTTRAPVRYQLLRRYRHTKSLPLHYTPGT
eukprot:3932768-Rhodomonas_salina.1